MGHSFTPELIRLLKQAGCVFVRRGKGNHDIWHSARSGTTFPVDHRILSRHTANGVLKQAGLPKQF
ncbi:MAG TPA: type II toxin-antitoxin system HicA family toxin [Rubrivivax sp.]|nr:type II toxin-antitoxin system HicA family toxin [Rubrivivax sp.]